MKEGMYVMHACVRFQREREMKEAHLRTFGDMLIVKFFMDQFILIFPVSSYATEEFYPPVFLIMITAILVAMLFGIVPNLLYHNNKEILNAIVHQELQWLVDYAVGVTFLIVAVLFAYMSFTPCSNNDNQNFALYTAALSTIYFTIFLRLVNNVLSIPLLMNFLLQLFATIPFLMAYFEPTTIIVPQPLVEYIGHEILELGFIYKLYLGLLMVFCSNSLKFHSAISGLGIGQTVIITFAISIYIVTSTTIEWKMLHFMSLQILQPVFILIIPLFTLNWYSSSVISSGDIYTYFAGMSLAIGGILGHLSETLLIFFLPQVLDFLTSCLRIFGFFKCPRYHLQSKAEQLIETNDGLMLADIFLKWFGPGSERSILCGFLLFQGLCCLFGKISSDLSKERMPSQLRH